MKLHGLRWLGAGFAISVVSLAALVLAEDGPAGRVSLAHRLLLGIGLAASIAPLALASSRRERSFRAETADAGLAAGGSLLATALFCLPSMLSPPSESGSGEILLGTVVALVYGASLAATALAAQRLLARTRLGAPGGLAAALALLTLAYASPRLASPVLESSPPAVTEAGIAAVIRIHPRAVVEGTCFELDPFRGRALYTGFPAATSYPYEYGPAGTTALLWIALAALGHGAVAALDRSRRSRPGEVRPS